MAVTLAQLIDGIKQEESGGNYSVVNSIGAVGAYQIMKANIPSWTQEALGRSMTWQQFQASPSSQDQVASYMLGKYYREYGAAGAAAMWFSGKPDYSSSASDGNTTVAKYVQNVLALASGSSASSSSSSSSGSGSSTAAAIDPQTLAEEYGFTSAFLNANPELKKIFNQAVTGQWSTDKFKAELMTTKWWSSHDAAERTYLTLEATDPGEAKQQLAAATVKAQQEMASLGVNVPAAQRQQILSSLAYNIAAKGWSDQQIQQYAGQYVTLTSGRMAGDAETQYSNGLQYAYSMGVTMSNGFYQSQVRKIEQGTSTYADMEAAIRQQATAKYSQFATQINGGQTVQDLASPYIQQMGTILEQNPSAISAFDPMIQKALTAKGTDGSTGQPLWEFENSLRETPQWLQTNNARDSIFTVAHQVLQDFGKAF